MRLVGSRLVSCVLSRVSVTCARLQAELPVLGPGATFFILTAFFFLVCSSWLLISLLRTSVFPVENSLGWGRRLMSCLGQDPCRPRLENIRPSAAWTRSKACTYSSVLGHTGEFAAWVAAPFFYGRQQTVAQLASERKVALLLGAREVRRGQETEILTWGFHHDAAGTRARTEEHQTCVRQTRARCVRLKGGRGKFLPST
ncbi:hypothetical protein CSUI_000210 [Cystoisospora suis]|uniref:Transmembrane protein n=1 Tax=Cystoisospora suis TaxID=483139 RepID=A0A2C6LI60_9APIC|nr:hypothetical protein CSUI_000210 [Cystoisospora suis]